MKVLVTEDGNYLVPKDVILSIEFWEGIAEFALETEASIQ